MSICNDGFKVRTHPTRDNLGAALQKVSDTSLPINWENVVANIDAGCSNSVDYVLDVSN